MKKEAMFWEPMKDDVVQCVLCPHNCKIREGKVGFCGVRKNEGGKLYSLIYGSCSGVADDPIEKKPLNHFYPGSVVLSLGSVGCNFSCLHCQNVMVAGVLLGHIMSLLFGMSIRLILQSLPKKQVYIRYM